MFLRDKFSAWLSEEKLRKQADDSRIFGTLTAYTIVGSINLYSLKELGEMDGWYEGFALAFVTISLAIFVVALNKWRKSYMGHSYTREASPKAIREYANSLREELLSKGKPFVIVEEEVQEKVEAYISKSNETVLESFFKNNNNRATFLFESNKLLFFSFVISLITPLILSLVEVIRESNDELTGLKAENIIQINMNSDFKSSELLKTIENLKLENDNLKKENRIIQEEIEDLQRYIK